MNTLNNTVIQMRIDKKTKKEAQNVLTSLGLDLSTAVKLFLKKVALTRSIPFEIRTENGFTPAQEQRMLREIAQARKSGKRYSDTDELIKALMR